MLESSANADEKVSNLSQRFTRIDNFTGCYAFLSVNFPAPVCFPHCHGPFGLVTRRFPSAEHAILSAKYELSEDERNILTTTDDVAALKDLLATAKESAAWPIDRLRIYEQVMRDKFIRNIELRQQLCDTGNRTIIWSTHKDKFFGVVNLAGQNYLGRILTEIRRDIQQSSDVEGWAAACLNVQTDAAMRPIVCLREFKDDNMDETLKTFHLSEKSLFVLGKLPSNDVVTLHPSLSRKHCGICVTKERVVLFDLGSKAGTYRNDAELEYPYFPVTLSQGDRIKLGASTRSYEVKVDTSLVLLYLEKKKERLEKEMSVLSVEAADPEKTAGKDASRLWIGNLPFSTTKEDVEDFFGPHYQFTVEFPLNKDATPATTASRGIAFVTFTDEVTARKAVLLDGRCLGGRSIKVAYAEVKSKRDLRVDGEHRDQNSGHWRRADRHHARQRGREFIRVSDKRKNSSPDISRNRCHQRGCFSRSISSSRSDNYSRRSHHRRQRRSLSRVRS